MTTPTPDPTTASTTTNSTTADPGDTAEPSAPVQTTHLVVLVDASGSMTGLEDVVVDGANALLGDLDPSVVVSIIAFDSTNPQDVVVDQAPAGEVAPLTREDYQPGASTPLYDAIGTAVRTTVGQVAEFEVLSDSPAGVVFAVITDGFENSSTRFTEADVRRLLDRRKAEGWDVRFIGLGVDAEREAGRIGIPDTHALSLAGGLAGTTHAFVALSAVTRTGRFDLDVTPDGALDDESAASSEVVA